ncbi:unnamed protein product, partial [Heterosigma akashiwo]
GLWPYDVCVAPDWDVFIVNRNRHKVCGFTVQFCVSTINPKIRPLVLHTTCLWALELDGKSLSIIIWKGLCVQGTGGSQSPGKARPMKNVLALGRTGSQCKGD